MASYQLEYDEKGPFLWALVESYGALPEFERLNRGDKNAELRLDKYYVVFEKNEQHGAE